MRFDTPEFYILVLVIAVNLLAFLIMLFDKLKSANGGDRRISEGLMFFLAAAFGSCGVYLGMFACRHKTQKWYFLVGIPLLMVQNMATAYLLYLWLK
jgi:uncharacterized membrane protein YsdA (DUF1294 family)